MRKIFVVMACAAVALTAAGVASAASTAPAGAKVYIVSPKDGAKVSSPVTVRFGLDGMSVAPAGTDKPNSGHHHLLIDVDQLPPAGQPIPKDDKHRHFGAGQTEAAIELPPGKHTLQLMLGDYQHVPHNPPLVSDKITITVEPAAGAK